MRKIKFRAWDETNKVMEYNVNVNQGEAVKKGYQWFSTGNTVRDSKLMQYTGLKDKNGKEIYEGDIVKWGHLNQWSREQPHRIAEVKFDPDIQFHSQVGVFNFGSFAYRDTTETDLEVLGNIYENPELMV